MAPWIPICAGMTFLWPSTLKSAAMKIYTAILEQDKDTGLFVGYVPGFSGAHSQAETLDELRQNLQEVIEVLVEDEEPRIEAEFVGTQQIVISRP
jgi:predicted RNase H-like HicB family nuclease